MCTCICIYTHTHALTHRHPHTDTYILTYTWTHRHAHKHRHRHTPMHACTHNHIQTSKHLLTPGTVGQKSACSVVFVSCMGLSRNWQWKRLPKRQKLYLQLHLPGHWAECLTADRTPEHLLTLKAPVGSWHHGICCLLPQRGFREGEGREGREAGYYAGENLRQKQVL